MFSQLKSGVLQAGVSCLQHSFFSYKNAETAKTSVSALIIIYHIYALVNDC